MYIVKEEENLTFERRKFKSHPMIHQMKRSSDFDNIHNTGYGGLRDESELNPARKNSVWNYQRRRRYRSMFTIDHATQTDFDSVVSFCQLPDESTAKNDSLQKNGYIQANENNSRDNQADGKAMDDKTEDSAGNVSQNSVDKASDDIRKDDKFGMKDDESNPEKTKISNDLPKPSPKKKRKEREAEMIMKYGSLWRLKEQRAKERRLQESIHDNMDEDDNDDDEDDEDTPEPSPIQEPEPEENMDDLEKLHRTLNGVGSESIIIEQFTSITGKQRQEIRREYKNRYDKDLVDMIERGLHGEFGHLVVASFLTPAEFDAECLHMSLMGFGTNEAFIRSDGMLVSRSNQELHAIKEQYKKAYGNDLDQELRADCSSSCVDLVLGLVSGQRQEDTPINDALAQGIAKKLYNDGKHKLHPSNNDIFKDLLTESSYAQIRHTFVAYQKMTKETIEEGMEKCQCTEKVLVNTVKVLADPVEFYTRRLHEALAGSGTDSTSIIRIVVSKSENDLPAIKEKYQELYEKCLNEMIEQDCPGHYKDMLLAFINNGPAIHLPIEPAVIT